MKNLVQIKGIGLNLHPNTTLNFNCVGMVIEVSLNIEPHLKPYFNKNRILKGDKMYMIKKTYHLKSLLIDVGNVKNVHDYLLNCLMKEIRRAKSKYYHDEAEKINVNIK